MFGRLESGDYTAKDHFTTEYTDSHGTARTLCQYDVKKNKKSVFSENSVYKTLDFVYSGTILLIAIKRNKSIERNC